MPTVRFFALFLALTIAACTGDTEKSQEVASGPSAARGRRVYLLNCTSCHNRDPSRDGSIGPAVKGASETLLKARILDGSYPPGYVPKRKSTAMRRYPHLKKYIPDLAAYLRDDRSE